MANVHTIEVIHEEFTKNHEETIKHFKLVQSQKKENINKLKELGFVNTQNVRAQEGAENITDTLKLISEYKVKFPDKTFITDEYNISLCKKWGLLSASVDRLIGVIPEKNQQEIIDFMGRDLKKHFVHDPITPVGRWIGARGTVEIAAMTAPYCVSILNWISDNFWSILRREANMDPRADEVREFFTNFPSYENIPAVDEKENHRADHFFNTHLHAYLVGVVQNCLIRLAQLNKLDLNDLCNMYTEAKQVYVSRESSWRVTFAELKDPNRSKWEERINKKMDLPDHDFSTRSIPQKMRLKDLGYMPNFSAAVNNLIVLTKPKPELRVVATPDQLDLIGTEIKDEVFVVKKPQSMDFPSITPRVTNDPIVQLRVKGGWIIISAWGEEAADASVTFPSN